MSCIQTCLDSYLLVVNTVQGSLPGQLLVVSTMEVKTARALACRLGSAPVKFTQLHAGLWALCSTGSLLTAWTTAHYFLLCRS